LSDIPAAEVIVIGAGPNGLAAAIAVAQAGLSVTVVEGQHTIGGGARSSELTLPGFIHDTCSAVHPLAIGSPFFRTLPLNNFGLDWIQPLAPLAHPLDDGTAVLVDRSIEQTATASALGADAKPYALLFAPLLKSWDAIESSVLGPIRIPRHPYALAKFGLLALHSAQSLAQTRFREPRARALFAGLAAHSMLPLDYSASAGFGLVLGVTAHRYGWPSPKGGAQKISDALAGYLRALGGQIVTGIPVKSLRALPPARAVICTVTPRQLLAIAGDLFPAHYRARLRKFRYGPGAFKIDYALAEPIPWRSPECRRAGTVHLGGTLEEIASSQSQPWQGRTAERPFVLLSQPTLFDPTRAPQGKHTAWAYCHVPNGCNQDMTARIESQIERFAPGFRDIVLARSIALPSALEQRNPNLIGGDINGGAANLSQLFLRPTLRLYRTGAPRVYIGSASTPPGGGVHGMCGYSAALAALRDLGVHS
jgi:phytoene dehydrogenase-like protein